MAGTKFYFAKFNISGTLPLGAEYDLSQSEDERKRTALEQYLNHNDAVVHTESGGWYFGRVEEHNGLIYGKFGKTFSDEPTLYDQEIGDFVELDEETPDADYSMFIIDFETRVIAFSSTYRVRNNNFVENFQKGFKNVISDAVNLKLELLHNEEQLENVLEEYPVFKIEAELRPTNPGPDPAFEDLDESMQEMLVEKLGISAERFEGEGINVHEDFIEQVTSMSMSEYGESWRVEYGDDDVLKVVSSESEPATTRTDEEIENLGALHNYSNQLISTAKSYLDQW
ncbi:hypothetical protein NGM10_04320 [Halorussus salilacus]|uniref:hypothetical protein n=1 Tax=Halorussus salilacus TaxID=2953750 RepID=UPI00209EC83F|nr:hypothetical protein [Halorussus salilacus]USZ68966.1 hypothetical protein NGM10_04320 [Halorussus salilacus]